MTPLTEDQLSEGLRTIATWGTPAAVPPLRGNQPSTTVKPLRAHRHAPGAAWWVGAAALVLAVVVVAVTTLRTPPPPPVAKGTWTPMAAAPIPARSLPASAWTGTRVVVVGGQAADGRFLRDAAAYNVSDNSWDVLPDAPADVPPGATALWTGSEVVVVPSGSVDLVEMDDRSSWTLADPIALNPVTEKWRTLPTPPAPLSAVGFAAGRLVGLVWEDGAGWQPVGYDDQRGWERGLPFTGAPEFAIAEWEQLVVEDKVVFIAREWRSFRLERTTPIGYVVDSVTLRSEPIIRPPAVELPPEEGVSTVVYANVTAMRSGLLLFVGRTADNDGEVHVITAVYDPVSRRWRDAAAPPPLPQMEEAFRSMTTTAIGDAVFLLGGFDSHSITDDVGGLHVVYDLDRNDWFSVPEPPVDLDRGGHVALWTGSELVVWGGLVQRSGADNRLDAEAVGGAVYEPPRKKPWWADDFDDDRTTVTVTVEGRIEGGPIEVPADDE